MSQSSRQALLALRRVATPLTRPQTLRTSRPVVSSRNGPAYLYRYSTNAADADPPPPPLLTKLKGDLKTAMRAKDAARLTVLRSIISATLNASKTASPITTDAKLVALLRATARKSQDAVDEFRAAGREDLAEKEEAQIRILDEYRTSSGIESVDEDQLRVIVRQVIEGLGSKPSVANVMKACVVPGGPLDGKDVEKSVVARVVKEEVAKDQV